MFCNTKRAGLSTTTGRILTSLLLLIHAAFVLNAQTIKRSQPTTTRTSVRTATAEVRLDDFRAEAFAGATRVTWRTSYEKNILGFRIWRDDAGERLVVNDRMTAGSLMQVGGGILEAGSEYEILDDSGSTNVYYWVEAVDINQKSRWYGPVYPEINFDTFKNEEIGETVAARKQIAESGQTDRLAVDLKSSELKLVAADSLVSATGATIAGDGTALKIDVKSRGVFRVEASTLAQYGFNAAQSANWRLFAGGTELPMIVNADGSIEFFGVGLDTIQTDTQVYWLITDVVAGRRMVRESQTFVKNARYSFSRFIAERKDKLYRISSVLNGARDNWYGAVVGTTPAAQTLVLSDIATTSGATVTVGVDLQGLTATAHSVSVLLNGSSIGTISYSAMDRTQWTATVALSRIVEGTNTITLQSLGGSSDISITEAVRINYPRNNRARGDRAEFTLAGGSQASMVKGFSNANVRVFDVTNPAQPSEIASVARLDTDGTYMVSINGVSTTRQFLAIAGTNQLSRSPSMALNTASNLRSTSNAANMIVVAPAEFRSTLTQFAAQRSSEGIQTVIVNTEDIFDEFNNGVPSADAIRAFFQYAKLNWSVKPTFALLAGDTSADPRNYSGTGGPVQNRVLSYFVDTWNMETVSDEMLADFNNDGVGEIALGRLPAKNVSELQIMLDKILTASPMAFSDVNGRGIHFFSDALIGYDFAAGSRNIASRFPAGSTVNFVDAAGRDTTQLRTEVVNRMNAGPAIVNYFGHGAVGVWANTQFFRNVDAATLYNPGRASFVAMIDCLNGYYAEGSVTSLAEAVIKQPNGGGNAVWASTGWNSAYDQEYFARDFYQKVFTGMPLGEAARQSKMLYGNIDMRVTYVLFGDPSQPLVR